MRSLEGNVFPQVTFAEFLVTWEGYKDGLCARDDILMTLTPTSVVCFHTTKSQVLDGL